LDETPLFHLHVLAPHTKEQELRTFLGSFGFTKDRSSEKVGCFSGGEKSRLALALIVWQKPNLLLLDEPTNHLDLEMRDALNLALQDYAGAMVLVSHDRFLVRSTTDQFMLVASGKLEAFKGDLTDYEKWLFDYRKEAQVKIVQPTSKKTQRQLDALAREERRPLIEKIKQCEKEMERLQEKLTKIELLLGDEMLYQNENKQKLQDYLLQQATLVKELKTVEEAWLYATDALSDSS
jgi:ATP-binding cassette subfamily F protein 3